MKIFELLLKLTLPMFVVCINLNGAFALASARGDSEMSITGSLKRCQMLDAEIEDLRSRIAHYERLIFVIYDFLYEFSGELEEWEIDWGYDIIASYYSLIYRYQQDINRLSEEKANTCFPVSP